MSIFKDNLLAKNESFISSSDALLKSSIQQERYRAVTAIKAVDRVRVGIQGGSKLNELLGNIGQLSNIIGATLGFGSKAIGPISELPIEQRVKINEWRFTKTRAEIKAENAAALRRTPDPSGSGSLFGLDSISLFPGQTSQDRSQLINKYGPLQAGMRPYSTSDGANAIREYIGKVFPFQIINLARVGQAKQQFKGQLATGANKNGQDQSKEIFPAYIKDINEQFNATWSQRSYIGRSEDVYIYNNASRSFNLDFTLFATNNDLPLTRNVPDSTTGPVIDLGANGLPIPVSKLITVPGLLDSSAAALMDNNISKTDLWRKIEFLESVCYPSYDEDGRFAKSPFCILDLGALYENQLMIVQSVNISYDPLVWDLNDKYYTPMFVNITLGCVFIHPSSPGNQSDGSFGWKDDEGKIHFLHRSDFN